MTKALLAVLALIFTIAVITLAGYFGFGSKSSTKFQIRSDPGTVLFAVTPWGDPQKVKESYRPLLEYLSQGTGKKFQFLGMEDYDVAVDNLIEGNVDIMVLVPISYVKAKEKDPNIKYIATTMMGKKNDARATYKGLLVTLKSKFGGMSFDDIVKTPKQYKIGFVSKTSASGYVYPVAMMKKRGLDPKDIFSEVSFHENHPSIFDALVKGTIDVGATWDGSFHDAVHKYGDIFEVVYTSPDIPNDAWAASPKMDEPTVKKIRELLIGINIDPALKDRLIMEDTHDKGWDMVDDSFYDEAREVMSYVGGLK